MKKSLELFRATRYRKSAQLDKYEFAQLKQFTCELLRKYHCATQILSSIKIKIAELTTSVKISNATHALIQLERYKAQLEECFFKNNVKELITEKLAELDRQAALNGEPDTASDPDFRIYLKKH